MARTKQKFRKTPRGGSLGLEKLNKDSSKDHQTSQYEEESDEKVPSQTNDNSIIIEVQGAETVQRAKVRMSSITTAAGTVSSNQSNISGEKKNHNQNQNTGKPFAQSVNSQSVPLRAPIKPPVSLATNKPPSSLPVVTNPNQGAYVNDRTVYVEGLPFASNEGEVRSFFSECGQILSVRLPTWHDTGRLKGYGHIEFASKDAVAQAFNLDGMFHISTQSSLHIQI